MNARKRLSLGLTYAILVLGGASVLSIAQDAGTMTELKQTVVTDGATQSSYWVRATQPLDSKLTGQKIQLVVSKTLSTGTSSRQLTINTGKHKTVGQMVVFIGEIFHHFLTGPVTPRQDLGKIGDVKYGGEIHFVADSADSLRYDIVTPEGPSSGSGRFERADVQAFQPLLSR